MSMTTQSPQPQNALTFYDRAKSTLMSQAERIGSILPQAVLSSLPAERFLNLALYFLAEQQGKLRNCSERSIIQGIYSAARDGLELGTDCYLVAHGKDAVYIKDYRGIIKILQRSRQVRKAFAEVVYENDTCEIDYGDERKPVRHVPALRNRGRGIGAYGAIVLKNGTWQVHYMDREDIDRVRKRAPGREQDTWVLHEYEMWRKTVLKNTAKYSPLSREELDSLAQDDASEEEAWEPGAERARQAASDLFGDDPPPVTAAPVVVPVDGDGEAY